MCGTLWHILASGTCTAGHFALDVQESLKCYCLKVRKVTPGSHDLHYLMNHNFQHTFTHILAPLSIFGGISVLRSSPPPQNGCLWAPGGLPPRFFRVRFH